MMRYLRRTGRAGLPFCLGFASTLHAAGNSSNTYDRPQDKLHVYVLIGDSTMAGTAAIADEQSPVIDRCFVLNDNNEWEAAKTPLNRYSTVKTKDAPLKLGPGYGFAKAMLAADKDISIGLIVNAAEGTKVEDWYMKSTYYRETRRRTKIARMTGTLKGVLWHHGCKTAGGSPIDEMKTLAANLRMDLALLNLPFIVGEVPGSPSVNAQIAAFSADVHATGVASAKGLVTPDQHQFDAAGVLALGERYAEQMLNVQLAWAARVENPPLRKTTLIDTHVHASENKENGLDVVDAWMRTNTIERCIVHTLTPTRAGNAEERAAMLANYAKYKGKIYRFCIIESDEVNSVEEAVEILKKEKADGAIGFGEHYGRNLMFDDPKNLLLYAACEKLGMPVMFHIDGDKNMDEKGFPRVQRVLKMFPECNFIAHAQWWMGFPDGSCDRMLQDYPNLYTEPSGGVMAALLNRDRGYTREFLIRNADKVMFGSDAGWWSIKDASAEELQFSIFEEIDLPDEVRTKIYRTNAEKLFGFASGE